MTTGHDEANSNLTIDSPLFITTAMRTSSISSIFIILSVIIQSRSGE